jgi:dUTP pyrophosphatase
MRKFQYVKEEFRRNPELQPLPQRGTSASAGYDFYCPREVTVLAKSTQFIWTDVKAIMPKDEFLQIVPRSSLATQQGLVIKNTIGIIDSDYANNKNNDGNIGICIYNTSLRAQVLKPGDRIAQGIFMKYYTVEEDATEKDRSGGFGSTS